MKILIGKNGTIAFNKMLVFWYFPDPVYS
jgi:hypothetical protein